MSANAGYTSNQGEVKQQERDTSAQNNGNSTQYGSSPASRSINNNNGLQNDGGFSSFDAASGNSYMSNSMGTGYSSGYGNSYGGGYGSSLGGGYGGYSSYGGGYGSSYGSAYGSGYGSSYGSGYGGYSSYGANNQYSNRMSKPLPQNNQEDVGPQQVPVSQDVWGLLNGMQAILQILYAGTGIVQFGKMFVKMSMKIMRLVCGKSLGVVFRLTGFNFLKNIITKMASGKDWTSEFSAPDLNLEGEWGNSRSSNTNKSLFGKIILVTRLCSILGAIFSWFLSNKASHNTTPRPVQNIPVPEIIAHEITTDQENVPIAFEDVNNIEDEVKLVENEEQYIEEQANNLVQAFENESEDMDGDLRRLDAFAEEAGIQVAQEEAKLENNKEEEIQISQGMESEVEVISAEEDKKDQVIFAADAMNALEEVIKINEVVDVPVVDNLEETVVLIKEEKDNDEENVVTKSEDEKPVEKVETMNPAPVVEAASDKPSDKILSEDFWKNKLDTLEETKKVEEKKEEKPEKAFEMPSVLQTLRDKPAASNKPWLMKKKKPVVEEKTESQASEAHTTTSTVSEVKAATENISEVKINESATPGNSENLVTADLINSAAVDSTHITL